MKPVALVLISAAYSLAQETPPTLRTETRVVQIVLEAKDSHGNPVRDLKKEDFHIRDDGKPRPIDIFSAEGAPAAAPPTRTPLRLPPNVFTNAVPDTAPGTHSTLILLDAINGYFDGAAQARLQVVKLMRELKSDERIAIYAATRDGVRIVQTFTTDRDLLLKSMQAWRPPPLSSAPSMVGSGRGMGRPSANEAEFYARMAATTTLDTLRAVANGLAAMPGRKSVIWLTSGFNPRWLRELDDVASKAVGSLNDANVALNPVDARGLLPKRSPTVDTMQELAERTGGHAYFDRNDIDRAMSEVIETARFSYTLGFYLPDTERDGRFHKLNVRVDRAGVELTYRKGYSAEPESETARKTKKEPLDALILNPLDSNAIAITARLEAVEPGKPRASLKLGVSIDPHPLGLEEKGDLSIGRIDEMFVEMDENGVILAKLRETKQFTIPKKSLAHILADGMAWPQSIALAPGASKLRIFIRDEATGQAGSLTLPIAVAQTTSNPL